MAVVTLKTIQSAKPRSAEIILEYDIDQALAFYSALEDQWWYPIYSAGLLPPFNPADYEQSIRRVATYRKNHPSPIRGDEFDRPPADATEADRKHLQDIASGLREHNRRVMETVRRYAE